MYDESECVFVMLIVIDVSTGFEADKIPTSHRVLLLHTSTVHLGSVPFPGSKTAQSSVLHNL